MISICIPNYNCDIRGLVKQLIESAAQIDAPFEIIVSDDHSNLFKEENTEIEQWDHCQYFWQPVNLGRSLNRNSFLKTAKYDWLLFMDGDAALANLNYLSNYVKHLKEGPTVICGGTLYQNEKPERDKLLHWKHGKEREEKSASQRSVFPNRSFSTFNFIIHKEILRETPFDVSISQYGHEDTLLGFELEKKGIPIEHINNPLIHNGLEETELFMEKTKAGLKNLMILEEKHPALSEHIKVMRAFKKVRASGLMIVISLFYPFLYPLIVNQLHSKNPSLLYFDVFKLLYLSKVNR